MIVDPKDALFTAARYLQNNPHVLKHVAVNARALKVTVPLDVLRYVVAKNAGRKNAPKEVRLAASPPALNLGATLAVMGTGLRIGAQIKIDEVSVTTEEVRFQIKLANVKLEVEGDGSSPIAALIKSGALDLSKPGNLARYMPNRSPALVEAEDDRLVIDLMRDEKVSGNARFRKVLGVVAELVGVKSIGTEDDSLVIELLPRREGVTRLVERARMAFRRR
jgi:hypothetical protein